MKKTGSLFFALLAALLLTSCSKEAPAPLPTTTAPETTTAATVIPATEPTEDPYPTVIDCASGEGYLTEDSKLSNVPCRVVTRMHRRDEPANVNYVLSIEVDTGAQVLQKELDPNVIPYSGATLRFADVDGDAIQEILVQQDTGGLGGMGIFNTWVLKVADGDIAVVCENFDPVGTGFAGRFLEDYQLEVTNSHTGYAEIFDMQERYAAVMSSSDTLSCTLQLDPFFVFEPTDVDGDGVSEILCKQYASLFAHADYAGIACSILKFDPEAQTFVVTDAWFETDV